jgi:hypothetical protein
MTPAAANKFVPRIAIAIASSHWRMRVQSPKAKMSATLPIVQKFARWLIAPNSIPSTNAQATTTFMLRHHLNIAQSESCTIRGRSVRAATGDARRRAYRSGSARGRSSPLRVRIP